MKLKILGISLSLILFTGCNNFFESKKYGERCDATAAIKLAENIVSNDLSNGKVKINIDKRNIVEWDYKNGRFLCKAKITGTYDKNMSFYEKSLLNPYGLSFNKNNKVEGWIFYQTYVTTVEMKKLKNNKSYNFYVEILNRTKLPIW